MALVVHMRWKIFHLDVETAFLNRDITQNLYIEQLEDNGVLKKREFVWKLFKARYGLKQAPRVWYSEIDSFLNEKGLQKLDVDYNLS